MDGLISNIISGVEQHALPIIVSVLIIILALNALILIVMLLRAAQTGVMIRSLDSIQGKLGDVDRLRTDIYRIREYTSQIDINTKPKNRYQDAD